MREVGLTRLQKSMQRLREHGTRTRYQQGCRCLPCRVSAARYQKERVDRLKAGEPLNRLVPAEKARAHIRMLSRAGIGPRTIGEVSGVHPWKIAEIKCGRLKNIRESNERKILAVTTDMLADGAHVSAKPVWRMIDRLKREGYTFDRLAQETRVARTVLVSRKPFVSARTRLRVQLFFERTMAA